MTTTAEVEVKEHPIIFSGPMVRAILEGRKTQTRRVLKTQPLEILDKSRGQKLVNVTRKMNGHTTWFGLVKRDPNQGVAFWCSHGEVGDRLWGREAFSAYAPEGQQGNWRTGENVTYVYRATDEDADISRWYSPIHLPRNASRITLEITDIRVQRIQEISEADAIAEGLLSQVGDGGGAGPGFKWKGIGYHGAGFSKDGDRTFHFQNGDGRCACKVGGDTPAQCAYREAWDSINAKRGYSWESNPWVFAITFKKL